jgi:hypothetical protein
MNGQFRGKRLFGGRLFAGRLFGPERAAVIGGGGRLRMRVPEAMLDQRIEEDDLLLLMAAALCAGGGANLN